MICVIMINLIKEALSATVWFLLIKPNAASIGLLITLEYQSSKFIKVLEISLIIAYKIM